MTTMSAGHHNAAYAHLRRVFDHTDVAFHHVAWRQVFGGQKSGWSFS